MSPRTARAAMLARRFVVHELRALHSLALWVLRRRHQVSDGALAVSYTGPQTAMMYGLLFVSVIETVMPALVIPWPLVDTVLLVVDAYGVLLILALHASCVVRPHVVGSDGYGALFDLSSNGIGDPRSGTLVCGFLQSGDREGPTAIGMPSTLLTAR
ncbi:hypothetical protein [Streptomyces gibsoniae]|uniref:hypothetical protein n=1 Tax=Streptomyces gibsoniae TaxID=3075529 RepID=UPI00374E1940